MVLIEPRDAFAAAPPAAMVTSRLVLRPPRDSDLDTLMALYADPAVTRFCAAATPQGRAATEDQLRGWIAHWQAHGFGCWAIAQRERPDTLIGFGGLMHRTIAGHPGLYLYYRISSQAWGRGLASEMALHAFAQAFEQRREGAVFAAVLPSNAPTRKTLECMGLRLKGTLADGPGSAAALLYELTAERWASMPRCEPEPVAFAA
jgi:[ribosomal protein S5]-alanine N-acetyltransferase